LKFKAIIALTIGIVMAIAFILFLRGVVLIVQDYSRSDVPKGENTFGLIVVSLLACASAFEAYRFLRFFLNDRRGR
jgi:membrane protein implicated in regulation of membrane protease activity